MTDRHIAMLFLFVLIVGFGATQCSQKGRAQEGHHGIGHAELHDKYKSWTPPNNPNSSCCNAQTESGEGDCRPTRAYVDEEGVWRAWNGYRWLAVPWERVLPTDYAGDGRSHLCEREGFVFCFSPSEPKS